MRVSENQELILGPPGSGKTSTVLNIVEQLIQQGVKPNRIAFVSFTKKAVTEAIDRACKKFDLPRSQFPMFKTVHAMCFAGLGISKKDVMGREHFRELGDWLGYAFDGTWDESEGIPVGSEKGDKLLFLENLARITIRPLRDVWEENYSDCTWEELEEFQDRYQEYKSSKFLMDFTDMLSAYISMCDPSPAQYAIVDEAQDLSPLQWQVLKHAFSNVTKTTIAGDDDQCQPAGTMVYTKTGPKDITELDEETDSLLVYVQGESAVYGYKGREYSFKKSVRPFSGKLYSVSCNGYTSRYTPNHKCIVRWSEDLDYSTKYVTYMMRKGDRYRVGMCELWSGPRSLRLARRAKVEGADAAWILRIHEDREEARLWEQVFSHKYALPQMCFGGDKLHLELIDKFYSLVSTESNARKLLSDLGLHFDYPIVDNLRNPVSKYGESSFKTYACNIIPELMQMRTFDLHTKELKWGVVEKTFEQVSCLPVYSLDVEKYHTYIADGIVTHNSIFRWSGADVRTFLSLEGEKRILSQSYRLPRTIHEFALNIISKVENRFEKEYAPRNEEGEIDFVGYLDNVEIDTEQSTLFLVRNLYLMPQVQKFLEELGIPYISRYGYSSVKSGHVIAIYAVEKLRKGETISGKEVKELYDCLRVGYYLLHGFKSKIQLLEESKQYSFQELNTEHGLKDLDVWYLMLQGINDNTIGYYKAVLANGYNLTHTPNCSLSTIHAAKGGEADHVVVLSDMAGKSYMEYEKSPDDERRVAYVAVTRAKQKLTIVDASGKFYFPYYSEGEA